MPRPPKPADPFVARANAPADQLPAIGTSIGIGHNSEDPELIAARGIRTLEFLELQIAALNTQKSAVFAELVARGIAKGGIKDKLADRRKDPLIAAEKRRVSQIYSEAIDRGLEKLARMEAEEKAARENAAPAQPSLDAPAVPPADTAFAVVELGAVLEPGEVA